jgi:hypothetical protein
MQVQLEDIILLLGSVLGGVATVLTSNPQWFLLGSVIGAAGKALGSFKGSPASAATPTTPGGAKQEKVGYHYQLIPVGDKAILLGELNGGAEFVGHTNEYVIIRTPKTESTSNASTKASPK